MTTKLGVGAELGMGDSSSWVYGGYLQLCFVGDLVDWLYVHIYLYLNHFSSALLLFFIECLSVGNIPVEYNKPEFQCNL